MSVIESASDPTTTKFEATEPSPAGKLPGEDPFKLHVHLKASLLKTGASGSFLRVESGSYKDYYMSIDGSGWAILTQQASTSFVLVPYYADHYVVVTSGTYAGYYLSFNAQSYIGAYSSWNNARYWSVNPLDSSPWPGIYWYSRTGIGSTYICVNGIKDGKSNELIKLFAV
jgi:hypothetical protein